MFLWYGFFFEKEQNLLSGDIVGNDPCVVPRRLKNAPFSVSFFIIPYFQEIVKKKTCFSAQVVIK